MENLELLKYLVDGGLSVVLVWVVKQLIDLMKVQRQQDTDRELGENKISAGFVDVIKALVVQINASTATLQVMQIGLANSQKTMTEVTVRREEQFAHLQDSIDKLPEGVRTALLVDFESIGDHLSNLSKSVHILNDGVQSALVEYAQAGAKISQILSAEQDEQVSSGADSAPQTAEPHEAPADSAAATEGTSPEG